MASKDQEWVALQRKIFSRWCRQKLVRRPEVQVNDIVTDIADGNVLIALIEELSEKKFTGRINKSPITLRIKKIENLSNALAFTWSAGVTLQNKPSPENLCDGDVASVLGLVWAIMLTFIRIGEDEESEKLNAKDALLMWCQNKCAGYPNVPAIENFKKSARSPFHSGIALCAIIHRHRPNLLPGMDKLEQANAVSNIEAAQEGAFRYFGLDKYLTPTEVTKLDESSMVIYVSEFYYGIAEQRKIDLAGRRINKLIKLTQENDRLKAEYNKTAAEYKERLTRVEATLNDRTIDDTLAGAKKRLEEFYAYKTEDKNVLLANQLSLEALFNNLAMRLSHHKRPEFVPPAGVSLRDVEAALAHLERVEQERSVALHKELNRQLRLQRLAAQHASIHENLRAWCVDKEAYLRRHDPIDTVGAAHLALRLLEAFDQESAATRDSQLRELHELGAELVSERYENTADVKSREADVDGRFELLGKLSAARKPVLDDDLARETLRQSVRLLYEEHCEKGAAVAAGWVTPKREYLKRFDEVRSVAEARVQLSLMDAYDSELAVSGAPQLEALRAVGARVLAARHESKYSTWTFEHSITQEPPRDTHDEAARKSVIDREAELVAAFAELADLAALKRRVLDDHLHREEYAERTRIIATTFSDKRVALERWLGEAEAAIASRPHVHAPNEARAEIAALAALVVELERMASVRLAEYQAIGAELLARSYNTELSQYTYEHAEVKYPAGDFHEPALRADVESALADAAKRFEKARADAAEKRKVYEDHLAREQFAEETRVVAKTHAEQYTRIAAWVAQKAALLAAREQVLSIADATSQLAILEALVREQALVTDSDVAALNRAGADLLARRYETPLSSYQYEETHYTQPQYDNSDPAARAAIGERQEWVTKSLTELSAAAEAKFRVVRDHLAREEEAAGVRMRGRQHDDMFGKVSLWMDRREQYLRARVPIRSVADAATQLTLLDRYASEREAFGASTLANFRTLGQQVLSAKYSSDISSYLYDHTVYSQPAYDNNLPERRASLEEHLSTAASRWETLAQLEAALAQELKAAHELELRKERLRLEYAHAALGVTKWSREVTGSLAIESFGFELEEVQAHQASVQASSAKLKEEGASRLAAVQVVADELTSLAVTENIYTSISMGDVKAATQAVAAAVAARDAAFEKELQRQIENDRLCREFAGLADPFSRSVIESKDVISSSKADLEAQLAHVTAQIAGAAKGEEKLTGIRTVAAKMEERGITYNKHTTLTRKDVEVQWAQFQKFLAAKKSMLETEIENAKLRGITPEQFREIEENFRKFDKDNSGDIDRKELTACLYSLGEERSGSEIKAIVVKFGDAKTGKVTSTAFKELMIHILGDSDSKEEVLNGFVLINKGKTFTVKALMEAVLSSADIVYIEQTSPASGEGHDYTAWVNSVFSR